MIRLAATLALLVAATAAADTVPPAVLAEPLESPAPGAPLRVRCQIVDETSVAHPTFYWRPDGAVSFEPLALRPADDASFIAELEVPAGTSGIDWYIEAFDGEANGPARFGSPSEPQHVRVPFWEPVTHPIPGWGLVAAGVVGLAAALALDLPVAGKAALAGSGAIALGAGVYLVTIAF